MSNMEIYSKPMNSNFTDLMVDLGGGFVQNYLSPNVAVRKSWG